MVAHLRAEFAAPRHDEGHPDTALAQRRLAPALAAAERVGAVEPLARRAGVRRRAVVARNDDYRIFPDAEPFEFGDQPAYLAANALAGTDRLELTVSGHEGQTIVTARFDNLGKGASGAAVQNMNLMLGFEETAGLNVD